MPSIRHNLFIDITRWRGVGTAWPGQAWWAFVQDEILFSNLRQMMADSLIVERLKVLAQVVLQMPFVGHQKFEDCQAIPRCSGGQGQETSSFKYD